jgi:hypothetical protein
MGIKRLATRIRKLAEGARYVVDVVYTDDGDATDEYMVFDTKQKKIVLTDVKDRAVAVALSLNQKTDSNYVR